MKIIRSFTGTLFLSGRRDGLLLVHGFTGTPAELRPMGDFFRKRGLCRPCSPLAGARNQSGGVGRDHLEGLAGKRTSGP